MKRQAGRPSQNNSSPVGIDLRGKQSLDVLGEEVGDSRNQIHRYIRLTELIPELLDLVDEGRIAFRPAVELSYLQKEEQGAPASDEQPTEISSEHPTETTAQASDHEAEKPQDTQAPKEK